MHKSSELIKVQSSASLSMFNLNQKLGKRIELSSATQKLKTCLATRQSRLRLISSMYVPPHPNPKPHPHMHTQTHAHPPNPPPPPLPILPSHTHPNPPTPNQTQTKTPPPSHAQAHPNPPTLTLTPTPTLTRRKDSPVAGRDHSLVEGGESVRVLEL
jgi:hypothetical protein